MSILLATTDWASITCAIVFTTLGVLIGIHLYLEDRANKPK